MAEIEQSEVTLVADIGGTNARLGLATAPDQPVRRIHKAAVREHPTFEQVLAAYLDALDAPPPERLCIGLAGPVRDNRGALTNGAWQLVGEDLAAHFGFRSVWIINDYVAQAWALPYLKDPELLRLGPASTEAQAQAPRLVCGPGTGLGVGTLAFAGKQPLVIEGEGGHIAFAPQNPLEIEILSLMRRHYDRVSMERILSGAGLVALHSTLAEILQEPADRLTPEEIVARGLSGRDRLCKETLMTFAGILGSFSGDLALALGAFGGVYLTGGVSKALQSWLPDSPFRDRFEAKGRMRGLLTRIPTWLIIADTPALTGAAAYLYHQEAV